MVTIRLVSGHFEALVTADSIADSTVNVGTEKEPKHQHAQDVVNDCGLTYIGQRDGWTNFYKPRLKKGQERSELEYSDALAVDVSKSLLDTFQPYLVNPSVKVGEHVIGEVVSEMKRATALVDGFMGTPKEASFRDILGSPNGDREELIRLAHEQKMGVTPPRDKKNNAAK
jgi:hypothetical protein